MLLEIGHDVDRVRRMKETERPEESFESGSEKHIVSFPLEHRDLSTMVYYL